LAPAAVERPGAVAQEGLAPMHYDPNEGGPSPAGEDTRDQRALLTRVLALHPTHLTLPELAREVCEDPDDFAEGDALARAVRDLAAAGLLRMNGLVVMPTRAAIHFDSLTDA
jgi:hypothetical protein